MNAMYYDRDGNPIDRRTAAILMEAAEARRVAEDLLGHGDETVRVSTVHLVLNHQFGAGPPVIFETMVFGGPHNEYQWRYSNEEQAAEGHRRVVAWLKGEGDEP